MTILNKDISKQILALFFLALGGLLLHSRIHPVTSNPSNYLPFVFGILNVFVIPIMFNYRKTHLAAYLITGFSVIIGSIAMAHMSIAHPPVPLTVSNILLKTTLADIFLLLPKLFIAHMIFLHYNPTGLGRLFTAGWWARHAGYLAVVYTLGNILWR